MFLGFFSNIMDIINVPLGWILQGIYWVLGNYGWSILVFALLAKLLLLPSSIKGQKNQLRMQAIQPKMKRLSEKYHNDNRNPKYQEELQALYSEEGYNPMSGCLPTLIQLPLIFGLWNVIRQPLTYICNFSDNNLYQSVKTMVESTSDSAAVVKLRELFSAYMTDGKLAEYGDKIQSALDLNQIYIADAINSNRNTIDGLNEAIQQKTVIDTEFMGINLGETASAHGLWSWFILIPIIAALSSFLVSFISMRMNKSKTDSSDPTAKSMNMMMYTMPLLSLWIGYSMNFGVALYWIANNLLSLAQTVLLPKLIKEKKEEKPVKEKKLNYTQIEKMKRDEEMLNGEPVKKKKK
ncbi:MAG: YidC/Oxa1 family membrane protein insertase [Clostridia bacterium]|nr:YidC/Oxa1 family membrane protein insertase [Clostridia bacterium]MBQ5742824.1 YidC/Oxa1 family membrane protein insertase [Clostridia bacterium]